MKTVGTDGVGTHDTDHPLQPHKDWKQIEVAIL